MEVIAGTYSHLIFGYEVKPNEEGKLKFSTSFTNDSHAGVVKCLTVNRRGFLASGSADESIRLFSLRGRRCEIGSLCQHNGSIVSLKFFKNSHLFSASEDGTIAIWKVNSWDCLKVLKHKEALTDFAIHPSGKLLLSLTKGRTLQTWNLLSGRRAFVTNLKHVGERILFSNDGDRFIVIMGNSIDIYTTEDAFIAHSYSHTSRISSITFLNNEILLVGDEGGVVNFLDVTSCKLIHQLNTNTVRVKGMQCNQQLSSSSSSSTLFVSSSDGYVKLYDVTIEEDKTVTTSFVTGVVTPHRWLCMAVYNANDEGEGEDKDDEDEICAEILKKSKKNSKSPKKAAPSIVKNSDEEEEDDDEDGDDEEGNSELEEDDGEELGAGDDENDDDDVGRSDKKLSSSGKRKQTFPDKQLKKKQRFAGKNDDESGDVRLKKSIVKSKKIVKKNSSKDNNSKKDSTTKKEDYVTFTDDDDDSKKPKNKKCQSKNKYKSPKKAFNSKENYVSFTDDDDNKKPKNKKFHPQNKYKGPKKDSNRKKKYVSFADDDDKKRNNKNKFCPQYKNNKSKNDNPKKTVNNRFNSKRRFNKRTKK